MRTLKTDLRKFRNTLFVNISQFNEMRNMSTRITAKVVGSLYVPINSVYYVDEDGTLVVHKLEQYRV